MSKSEIISEINRAIQNAPEELLSEVLDLLSKNRDDLEVKYKNNLEKILNEDKDLLKELAK